MHDRYLTCIGTYSSMKSGGVKHRFKGVNLPLKHYIFSYVTVLNKTLKITKPALPTTFLCKELMI